MSGVPAGGAAEETEGQAQPVVPAGLSAVGSSDSTVRGRDSAISFFETFRTSSEERSKYWTKPWAELDEKQLRDRRLYQALAKYAVEEHERRARQDDNSPGYLMYSTVNGYIRRLLLDASRRCETSQDSATQSFFKCLDTQSGNPSATWLRGLFKQIERSIGLRAKETGESLSVSVSGATPEHHIKINRAFSRADGREVPQ